MGRTAGVSADETERELLESVLSAPDDLSNRLVLADLWMARGDPRGEFVAAQCRLHHEELPYHEREELKDLVCELLQAHEGQWLGSLGLRLGEGGYVDGFVEWLWLKSERLAVLAPEHAARMPVRSIQLNGAAGLSGALREIHRFSHLTSLYIAARVDIDDVSPLLERAFPRLNVLWIDGCASNEVRQRLWGRFGRRLALSR